MIAFGPFGHRFLSSHLVHRRRLRPKILAQIGPVFTSGDSGDSGDYFYFLAWVTAAIMDESEKCRKNFVHIRLIDTSMDVVFCENFYL